LNDALLPVREMHTLMGFEDVWAFDERWKDASDVKTPDRTPHDDST
jgi:hypothetical protein